MKYNLNIIICFVLVACNSPAHKAEKRISLNDSIENSVTIDKFDDLDIYEKQQEEAMVVELKEFKTRMLKKSYNFDCIDECSSGANANNLSRYKKRQPFNIYKVESDTNFIVEFRFIDYCCEKHVGDIHRDSKLIELSYKGISSTICECYCGYEYRFDIKRLSNKTMRLTLNGKQI